MIVKIEKIKKEISSVEEWYELAAPKGEKKHWKVGRSAMEMAKFALSEHFSKFISDVTKQLEINENSYICEPEKKTYFAKGMGKGGPRQHDLLMIGENSVIGVEAKVSEHFDIQIKKKRRSGESDDNMNVRLNSCINYLYGEHVPDNVEDLYYQLLSATIGTILEAKRNKKKKAISLFITFVGNVEKEKDYHDKVEENRDAFITFCKSLGLDENGGQLSSIPGLEENQIECWIKYVEIQLGSTYEYKV